MGGKVSELEDIKIEIIQSEEQRQKSFFNDIFLVTHGTI